jgi:glycerol-3-phosphate acyltransferase PlsY
MNILMLASGFVLAYLIGSFSSAVWIGRWLRKTDVRDFGSKNAGTTNTIRVLGIKIGLFVFFIDVFKGWLAVFIGLHFFLPTAFLKYYEFYALILAVSVVAGHIFPLYTGFKGGKGVATALGALLAIFPYTALLSLSLWVVIFLCTRYVSVASIVAAISFPVFYFFIHRHDCDFSITLLTLAIIAGVFIPIMHHKNIKRLLSGTENRMSFKKKS